MNSLGTFFLFFCVTVVVTKGNPISSNYRYVDKISSKVGQRPPPIFCLECAKWCKYGLKPGPNGCPLCECNLSPTEEISNDLFTNYFKIIEAEEPNFAKETEVYCEEYKCIRECLYGYKDDEYGCNTCECFNEDDHEANEIGGLLK